MMQLMCAIIKRRLNLSFRQVERVERTLGEIEEKDDRC